MNKREKISYIQRCITDQKINHNYIKTFIEIHEIKYTENMNGSFVNLSIFSSEDIVERILINASTGCLLLHSNLCPYAGECFSLQLGSSI